MSIFKNKDEKVGVCEFKSIFSGIEKKATQLFWGEYKESLRRIRKESDTTDYNKGYRRIWSDDEQIQYTN